MKLHNLQKIYDSLKEEKYIVDVNSEIREKAKKPIQKMLELSK
jgi:quinolinate synthase